MTGAEFREVDIDLLADYIGGALAGTAEESAVATLIADDPAWRAAYESLSVGMAAIGDELAGLEPEPMPDDVIARLDAALAAPPAPQLTLIRVDDEDEAPRPGRPGSARRLRWATPIAIAAGVIAFVGFGLDYLAGRDSTRSDTAASGVADSAKREAGQMPAQLSSGTDYTALTLPTARMAPLMTASDGAESKSAPLAAPDKGGVVRGQSEALDRLRDPAALRECLDAIAAENGGSAIDAQTVDFARFNGAPAVVVRFAASNGSWAWAAGPACGTGGAAHTLAKSPVR